jgi:uncharacterized metal-binding protein YceD (DUF177 family)
MIIDVNSILQAVGDTFTVEFEETLPDDFDDEVRFLEPVKVKATLANGGLGIMVSGQVQAHAELICGICLKSYEKTWTIDFEERFVPDSAKHDDGLKEEQEIKGEDIYYTYHDYEIDLSEMLREVLILSLPTAPKCDINCSVKNYDEEKTIDPRLKILARLKDGG